MPLSRPVAGQAARVALCIRGGLSAELVCTVEVDRNSTVQATKAEIERAEGTPWESQRLMFQGRTLLDNELLEHVLPNNVTSAEIAIVRLSPARVDALRGLREGRVELEDLGDELQADREFVLAAVHADGHALQFASELLRHDREVVLAAVAETGMALRHALGDALHDREVVLTAVGRHSEALQYAPEVFRADRDVVLSALESKEQDEMSLRFASTSLSDDLDFMRRAVHVAPSSLRYASERLQQDRELVWDAIEDYPEALFSGGRQLQGDREFVLAAVRLNGRVIMYAAPEVREDPYVLAAAMKNTPEALAWMRRLLPEVRQKILSRAHAILDAGRTPS